MLRRGDTLQARLKKNRASGRRDVSVRSGQQQSMEASSWRLELCLLDCLLFNCCSPLHFGSEISQFTPNREWTAAGLGPVHGGNALYAWRLSPGSVSINFTAWIIHPFNCQTMFTWVLSIWLFVDQVSSLCQWDTASRRASSNQPVYLDKWYYVSLGIMSLCDKT